METPPLIATYIQWAMAVAMAAIVLRAMVIAVRDFFAAEQFSLSSTIGKITKHIKALIICVCVEGITAFIKTYFF